MTELDISATHYKTNEISMQLFCSRLLITETAFVFIRLPLRKILFEYENCLQECLMHLRIVRLCKLPAINFREFTAIYWIKN